MSDTIITGMQPLNRLLRMAVVAGVESAIKIHIDRGDDINARDGNGLTPLMLAAARNRPAICKILIDAGADAELIDPTGKTAYAIAVASGACEAAALLESAVINNTIADDPVACKQPGSDKFDGVIIESSTSEKDNVSEFDLSGWSPEEDSAPPESDESIAHSASKVQAFITKFAPLDSSTDWEDIDVYLPEASLPLTLTTNSEVREQLRLLLLRAVREGSVPTMSVEQISVNEDNSPNPEAETQLSMVINDLGAEIDERFEYSNEFGNFQVFVNPEETPSEEEIVSEALAQIDNIASRRYDPIRIYQRDFQRLRLISGDEEILLCQTMESSLERALDALAAWPHGIGLTLAAGQLVKTGQKPLSWLSLGSAEAEPHGNTAPEEDGDSNVIPEHPDDEIEAYGDSEFDTLISLSNPASDFLDTIERLATLPVGLIQEGEDWRAVRENLAMLRVNRRFLLEIAEVTVANSPDSAVKYRSAMKAYQTARDRMITANLKLVFHLAKKYLYSGEPLDDLAQEGNIGLFKAVDKFDWRRGFKFSTYATWWIRQQIQRHIADKCRTIRLPVHVHEKIQRLVRETQAFECEIGHTPKLDEIAVRMGIPAYKVAALQKIASETESLQDLSVDELISADSRSDFISPDPTELMFRSQLPDLIGKLLATLKPKEEQIIRLRFGIGGQDTMTLEEIGQRLEVTRERVRQIESSALRKLKNHSRMDIFARAGFCLTPSVDNKDEKSEAEPDLIEPSQAIEQTSQSSQFKSDPEFAEPIQEVEETFSSLNSSSFTKSPRFEKILAKVAELGIPINDERHASSGKIWINVPSAADSRIRSIVRKLVELGFEFQPGKGYYR